MKKKKQNNEEFIEMSLEEFDKFAEVMDNIITCVECEHCMNTEHRRYVLRFNSWFK